MSRCPLYEVRCMLYDACCMRCATSSSLSGKNDDFCEVALGSARPEAGVLHPSPCGIEAGASSSRFSAQSGWAEVVMMLAIRAACRPPCNEAQSVLRGEGSEACEGGMHTGPLTNRLRRSWRAHNHAGAHESHVSACTGTVTHGRTDARTHGRTHARTHVNEPGPFSTDSCEAASPSPLPPDPCPSRQG